MVFLYGCSDKYVAFQRIDVAPNIITDKDSITIRVNDYSNYYKGAGFLKISAVDTLATGDYLNCFDSTGHLEVLQDSTKINGLQIAINQAAILYVGCKDTGTYPLTIQVVDRFGKMSKKTIPVKVISNIAATPVLNTLLIASSSGQALYILDATLSKAPISRIISYSYSIDGSETTLYQSSIKTMLYTGVHEIQLKVYDDLGLCSPTFKTQITVQ
jgi:hypothetical protein